jgi:hypothetical protein
MQQDTKNRFWQLLVHVYENMHDTMKVDFKDTDPFRDESFCLQLLYHESSDFVRPSNLDAGSLLPFGLPCLFLHMIVTHQYQGEEEVGPQVNTHQVHLMADAPF